MDTASYCFADKNKNCGNLKSNIIKTIEETKEPTKTE